MIDKADNNLIYLAERTVQCLRHNALYITTVESCTGGGIANCITNVEGASDVFYGAKITYSTDEKILFGISESVIEKYTVYSKNTAEEMARQGLKNVYYADISVAITGSFSRIDPKNPNSECGVIYIAVADKNKLISDKFTLNDNKERRFIKAEAIKHAFEMTLNFLECYYSQRT